MEALIVKSNTKLRNTSTVFSRYLIREINHRNRLISVQGARGTGKTTLLLQIGKEATDKTVLYVALDDLFFTGNTLYGLAEKFNLIGGNLLLLDEVHKYPNWSQELKLIYDDMPNLHVIFTSSSILNIYKGESDLSRRAVNYKLVELSFREFLLFREKIELPVVSFQDIITNHEEICIELLRKFKPFKHLLHYTQVGSYPYYDNNIEEYHQKLLNTVNLILEIDLQGLSSLDYAAIAKIKRLLYIIASNVPFIPNVTKLSGRIGINRNLTVHTLQLLGRAELIHTLVKHSKSVGALTKPDKIWMHNTNLNHAISANTVNIGTIRETFVIQHLRKNHRLALPDHGDLMVDGIHTLEIGGKNKTNHQIKDIPDSYVVKDDIEIGALNTIPMWLFGLLY